MNVFELRNRLVIEYGEYTRSFINIRLDSLRDRVTARRRMRTGHSPRSRLGRRARRDP